MRKLRTFCPTRSSAGVMDRVVVKAPPQAQASPGQVELPERLQVAAPSALTRHSGLMSAVRITLAHFSVSSKMSLPKSAGGARSAAPPSLRGAPSPC